MENALAFALRDPHEAPDDNATSPDGATGSALQRDLGDEDYREADREHGRSFKRILLWRSSSRSSVWREGCSPLAPLPPPHCVPWRTPTEATGPTSKSNAPSTTDPTIHPASRSSSSLVILCMTRVRGSRACVCVASFASDARLRAEFIRYPSFRITRLASLMLHQFN
jgi:hypothetical protein